MTGPDVPPDLIGTIGHINEARPEFAGGRVEPFAAGRRSPPTDGTMSDLPARLRTMADRTWSDTSGWMAGGYALDGGTRALLHEAADAIETLTRDTAGFHDIYETLNEALRQWRMGADR